MHLTRPMLAVGIIETVSMSPKFLRERNSAACERDLLSSSETNKPWLPLGQTGYRSRDQTELLKIWCLCETRRVATRPEAAARPSNLVRGSWTTFKGRRAGIYWRARASKDCKPARLRGLRCIR